MAATSSAGPGASVSMRIDSERKSTMRAVPFLAGVDGFIAVPPSDPATAFSLPRRFAAELRAAGAKTIFGLAAVKTLRNDDNVPRPAGGTPGGARQDDDWDLDDDGVF